MNQFKPMLASAADLSKLRFPLLASPKIDGVRAVVKDGIVLSRSLKKIPNKWVQSVLAPCEGYDGELVVGSPTDANCMQNTTSGVMSIEGTPGFSFYVFDRIDMPDAPYHKRRIRLSGHNPFVLELEQNEMRTLDDVLEYEQRMLGMGFEGLILRDPMGPYKYGRSTAREGYLLKVKRFEDSEFEVIGYEERQHNGNEATTNELGRTKRSSHKAGKSGLGDLGALVLRGDGFTFNCGTGFDDATRKALWAIRDDGLIGRIAKVKHFPVGVKVAPRHPVFLGFRDPIDL